MISSKMVLHSISESGKQIYTMLLKYPRFIHAEIMTHRALSRNANSSRAVPVKQVLQDVWNEPATPEYWGSNNPGMTSEKELNGYRLFLVKFLWNLSARTSCLFSWSLSKLGAHKQIANRITEPYQHIVTLVTATELENFFKLRDHPDAQPEIQTLAKSMKATISTSEPQLLKSGEWHLPFVDESGLLGLDKKFSAARCARTTFGVPIVMEPQRELDRYERLIGDPAHASPMEHQATPDVPTDIRVYTFKDGKRSKRLYEYEGYLQEKLHGNFVGWIQNRKVLGI